MSQDDPEVTPLDQCRYEFGFPVPEDWQGEGEISIRQFPACEIAAVHCRGDIYKVDRAWQYLYRYWLPNSRYQPANLPVMEIYQEQPAALGWETFDLECAVPITTL
ncbi:MAG: GyrI-like domain-containing protein [Anaerolineae bacterium]|nr:GyrI-like domain-containing protein [Anaerolineae bacterium]